MASVAEHVVVVGGGVIGAATAYYLQQFGCQVTIIDRGSFAGACSHANCGLITPSHVLPLAEPGVLSMAIKNFFKKNAPLSVKPRADWSLITWLFNFAKRCNFEDMLESAHGIQPILDSSRTLYQQLITSEQLDCEWQTKGLLFVYETKAGLEHFVETNQLLDEVFDAGAKLIHGDELQAMEPALKPGLAGAWFYHDDAHLRPDKLMTAWRKQLTERGARIMEQCEFQGFQQADDRITGINTSQGPITADSVVVATGAWTALLAKQLGCPIPIQPGKGYSMTMPRPKICPKYPLLLPERRVAVTPMNSGYRLGSIMELSGYDTSLNPERLTLLREGAERYLQEPYCDPVVEEWYGWRPLTWDSRPILDRAPVGKNVWIAAGHNMLGLSMAPASGKLLAEMLTGREPHINPRPYRLDRF
jgi:D-amino-acid dehydrogenase